MKRTVSMISYLRPKEFLESNTHYMIYFMCMEVGGIADENKYSP